MTLRQAQSVFTANVAKLINYAFSKGYELTFGEAFRTPEQQAIYLKKGLSKTSQSKHLVRLAVDFNLFVNGKLVDDGLAHADLAKYWEGLNEVNRAGYTWGWDAGHFEMNFKD